MINTVEFNDFMRDLGDSLAQHFLPMQICNSEVKVSSKLMANVSIKMSISGMHQILENIPMSRYFSTGFVKI